MRRLDVSPDPVVMLDAALQEAARAAGVESRSKTARSTCPGETRQPPIGTNDGQRARRRARIRQDSRSAIATFHLCVQPAEINGGHERP